MGYLDILKSSLHFVQGQASEEADNTPQEVIRAELSKKFPLDVRKIYAENLYELCSLRSASNCSLRSPTPSVYGKDAHSLVFRSWRWSLLVCSG